MPPAVAELKLVLGSAGASPSQFDLRQIVLCELVRMGDLGRDVCPDLIDLLKNSCHS